MTDDAVSVVIPTYNRAHLITRAVDSVLAAVERRDEVIVVDDGSTDGTHDVLMRYGDRIRYVLTDNRGAGAARNRGIEVSSRPLVAFLDSDDEWTPDKLYLQRRALEACEDAVMCCTNLGTRRRDGSEEHNVLLRWQQSENVGNPGLHCGLQEVLERTSRFSQIASLPAGRIDFDVFVGNAFLAQMLAFQICSITVLVDRRKTGQAFWFPEDLPTYEDCECFGRLASTGPAVYLDCETAWQWVHGGARVTNASDIVSLETRISVLKRVWGNNVDFLSLYGHEYEALLRRLQLKRARYMLIEGAAHDAREEIHSIPHAPLVYRTLSLLPGWFVRGLLKIWRLRRRWLYRERKHPNSTNCKPHWKTDRFTLTEE